FNENLVEEGVNRLLSFTEDIVSLSEGLTVIDPEQNIFDITDINNKMNRILEALEMSDPFYVSELMEHEVIPLLSYWEEKLSKNEKH
ncbi:MAG TPA: hypothetical protein VIG40_08510, partial [Tissierellaceae bacterium]